MMKPDTLYIVNTDHPGTQYTEAGYWKDNYFYISFKNGKYKLYYTDIATNSFKQVEVLQASDPEVIELIEYIKGLARAGKIRDNLIFSIDEALNITRGYETYQELTQTFNRELKKLAENNNLMRIIIYGLLPSLLIGATIYIIKKLRDIL